MQAAAGEHTHPKKKSGWVCEEGERETASQMNQPSEATSVCVCEEEKREKRKEKKKKGVAEEQKESNISPSAKHRSF